MPGEERDRPAEIEPKQETISHTDRVSTPEFESVNEEKKKEKRRDCNIYYEERQKQEEESKERRSK